MNKDWKYSTAIVEGELYTIHGLNIWDYEWKSIGQSINVKDPLYGQDYTMTVFEIADNGIVVTFAAGEFSNGIWGIYQNNE